jgi:hypothetical protein
VNHLQAHIQYECNPSNREHSHALRLSLVTAAILQVLTSGNSTAYTQAATAATGKGQIPRAYMAGFSALPSVDKPAKDKPAPLGAMFKPTKGGLTKEQLAQCEARASELTQVFSAAFCDIRPMVAPVKSEEDKAAAKAKRETKAHADAIDYAKSQGYVPAVDISTLAPAALADAVVQAIASGALAGENSLTVLRALFAQDAGAVSQWVNSAWEAAATAARIVSDAAATAAADAAAAAINPEAAHAAAVAAATVHPDTLARVAEETAHAAATRPTVQGSTVKRSRKPATV